jgi:trimethylamine--corrinoid protein Co-methyltransferase
MGMSFPYFKPLRPEDITAIDVKARQVLSEVGVRIEDNRFLNLLKKSGLRVDKSSHTAYLHGSWLDEKLDMAPARFTLYSRDGANDLYMGGAKVHFGNGGRVFRVLDMATGGYRETYLRDIADTATIVQHLDRIGIYIIACQAHDVGPEYYHVHDFYHAFNHTTKHVMGGCDSMEGAAQMYELACIVAEEEEELQERPFVSVITNPISPLTFDSHTLQVLEFFTRRMIPVTCATAPIAGATAPVTLAGTLVQMHAEELAAVAVIQAITPGAKVLYGAFPTVMDLKTMEISTGSVEMGMMNASAVQLAKLYDIPIYASGGVTEAKRPDIQAGFEKNFSNLMVAMMGADFIHLSAGLMDSANSLSYEQLAIDDENIALIQRILSGIEVSPDTLAFEAIKEVGPRGNYLVEEHTVRHLHELFYPTLGERCSFEIWEEKDQPSMVKRAKVWVRETLAENREGILDMKTIQRIRRAFPDLEML